MTDPRTASAGTAYKLAVLALAACLMWPAMWPQHLEAFTAQTQSLAWLKAISPTAAHDPYLPLVVQFVYQSRSAVVDVMALVYALVPVPGDWCYQGLTVASLLVLLLSSMAFARQWGQVAWWWSLPALALTPGVVELGFFLNDNVVAAACAASALAMLPLKQARPWRWVASGVLLALAMLCRLDSVLVAPLMLGLILAADKTWSVRAHALLLCFGSALFVLVVHASLTGFSILDTLSIAGHFATRLGLRASRWAMVRVYFIGLITPVLIIVGVAWTWREMCTLRGKLAVASLIVYPVLLFLFAPRANEIRYIFPLLAPVLALWGGLGVRALQERIASGQLKQTSRRWLQAGLVVVLLAPPMVVHMSDGPRVLIGRLWSTSHWHQWQRLVAGGMTRMQGLVHDTSTPGAHLVLSSHFNDDLYFRLRMVEAGFRARSSPPGGDNCRSFTVYEKGAAQVYHLRTEALYTRVPLTLQGAAATQIAASVPCQPTQVVSRHLTAFGSLEPRMPTTLYPLGPHVLALPPFDDYLDLVTLWAHRPELMQTRRYGRVQAQTLTASQWQLIEVSAIQAVNQMSAQAVNKPIGQAAYFSYYRSVEGPTTRALRACRHWLGLQP